MKNIKINFDKPYNEKSDYKVKISFDAEFDNEIEALNFHSDLNKQIMHYKEKETDATV